MFEDSIPYEKGEGWFVLPYYLIALALCLLYPDSYDWLYDASKNPDCLGFAFTVLCITGLKRYQYRLDKNGLLRFENKPKELREERERLLAECEKRMQERTQ